jgi:hypothetical protein
MKKPDGRSRRLFEGEFDVETGSRIWPKDDRGTCRFAIQN